MTVSDKDERLIREGEIAVIEYLEARAKMDHNNIVPMPTSLNMLADRIRSAIARVEQSQIEWIEATLDLAVTLKEARDRFQSNQQFSIWLAENEIDLLGHQDRAALINMAGNATLTRLVLQETQRRSWRLIWEEEIMPRLTSAGKTADSVPPHPKTDATTSTIPLASDPTSAQIHQKEDPPRRRSHGVVGSGDTQVKDASKLELVKLLGVDPADLYDLLDAYPRNRQRELKSSLATFARAKGKRVKKADVLRLFNRAVEVVRAGKAPELSNVPAIDVRIFFPSLPEAFCKHITLTAVLSQFDRYLVADARANELLAIGASMSEIFRELAHIIETGRLVPCRPAIEFPANSRIRHEVKYCGEIIWPGIGLSEVSYEDLKAGWHLADHWLKYIEAGTPQKPNEVLTQVLHLCQDIKAATTIDGLCRVMSACIAAYAKRNARKERADFSGAVPPGLPR
jgi:hypothetical protein